MEGNSIDNNCFCLEKDCTKIDESLSDLERREFFSGNNISDSDSDSDSDNNDEINVHINEYPIENTSNEHIKSTDKVFVEQKSTQQIIDESKLKTEQELIKLGQQLKEKEQKENNLKTNLTKSKDILSKYKDKDSIQIVD